MPENRLKALLAELNDELEATSSLDPELADRLQRAASAVDQRLHGEPASAEIEEDQGVIAELLEADQRFEIAHPTLAGTLRRILATLSDMGI